jgi:hypothetical protein
MRIYLAGGIVTHSFFNKVGVSKMISYSLLMKTSNVPGERERFKEYIKEIKNARVSRNMVRG